MRILQVVDVQSWIIGKLAAIIEKNNPHLQIKTIAIHPKDLRNNPEAWISSFKNEIIMHKPDVIHFHYWDVANTLRPHCGEAKVILTHHNQKNLLTHDWRSFDHLVCHTNKAKKILNEAGYAKVSIIQHGLYLEHFRYLDEYDPNNRMVGFVGRVCRWKGLLPILKAAKNIGTKVIMMGRVDKADVWSECQPYQDQMDVRFNTLDEQQPSVYHEMGVYVGNSDDNIEEGPLGLLEAMACGIPVITTAAGEAADIIEDRKNGMLIPFNDDLGLEVALKQFFELSPEEKETMRENAWDTVKRMTAKKMATQYEQVYYKVAYQKDLVSVIIPTHDRAENLTAILNAYSQQTYQPIEIIVCDDKSGPETKEAVFAFAAANKHIPVKYTRTSNEGYCLAEARNRGIFEASGYYLVFNDDRMIPDKDAVLFLIKRLSSIKVKSAVWGNKGAGKRNFIENFFAIRKRHLCDVGMFNERINLYGGMSQEFRQRLNRNGFTLEYEGLAMATPAFGTRRNKRRYEIIEQKYRLWKLDQ